MNSKNIIPEKSGNLEEEIKNTNSTNSEKTEHIMASIAEDEEQIKVRVSGKTSDQNGYGTDGYLGFIIELKNEEERKKAIEMIEEANKEYGPALKVTKIPDSPNKLIITNNTLDIVYTDLALKEMLSKIGYLSRSLLKILMTNKPIEILQDLRTYKGITPYIPPNFDNTGKKSGL